MYNLWGTNGVSATRNGANCLGSAHPGKPHRMPARGAPIVDEPLPANEDRFVLRVADGRAEVERGGEGHVRLDVRTLAPLYSGFASAAQLRTSFGLACDEDDAGRLTAVFGGSAPWIQVGF